MKSQIFLRKSSRNRCVEAFEGPAHAVAKRLVPAARATFEDVVNIADEGGEGRLVQACLNFGMVLHILVKLRKKIKYLAQS